MEIKLGKKKTIIILTVVILVLMGIIAYMFFIGPSIQNIKVEAHKQGVLDVISYINNQIQINGLSKINLEDRVILCQYGK